MTRENTRKLIMKVFEALAKLAIIKTNLNRDRRKVLETTSLSGFMKGKILLMLSRKIRYKKNMIKKTHSTIALIFQIKNASGRLSIL